MARDLGLEFRALHQPGNPFILANAWDGGSAKMLAGLGAKAIATSSAAQAFTLGRPDGTVTRDEALAHAQDLMSMVDVPVSGDFENGFGDNPDDVAETVRLSGEIGLAGICIEDTRLAETSHYDRALAVERIRAAVAAARALPHDFFLVARADGVMIDTYDIEEALWRIKAFDDAGADGLYVPLPKSLADLQRVVDVTDKPVNVLAAGPYSKVSQSDYAKMGLARISLGSALARATHRVIFDAAKGMFEEGDLSALSNALPGSIADGYLGATS